MWNDLTNSEGFRKPARGPLQKYPFRAVRVVVRANAVLPYSLAFYVVGKFMGGTWGTCVYGAI